jgi:hypothetical protein
MPDEQELTQEESELIGNDFFSEGEVASDSRGGSGYYESSKTFEEMVENIKSGNGVTSYSEIPWNPFESDKILGLPLYYNDLADPSGRVFNQTIIADLPHVYIIPGVPQVNRNLINVAGKRIVPAYLSRKLLELQEAGVNFGVRGIWNGDDLRFIGFKTDYSEYYKYVQTMLSAIYSYLDNTGVFDVFRFSEEFENSLKNFGLCFYADKATSSSESADNTYGSSRVAEMVADRANAMREADLLNPFNGKTARIVDSIKALNPLGVLEAMGTFDGTITRTANALFRVINGSNLFFPEVWQDSRFDKSYNISFKFYSPYGDKLSIFRFVYVPFIALLALALPRQDGLLGYEAPFIFKMSSPGRFDIDMGAVTSMTIQKGGSDNLWTSEGLPQMIEVNMNVIDLYPQLIQVKQHGLLAYNIGLSSFLENMAGIRPSQLNFHLRLKALVNRKINNSFIFNIPENVEHWAEDFMQEVGSKIAGFLR